MEGRKGGRYGGGEGGRKDSNRLLWVSVLSFDITSAPPSRAPKYTPCNELNERMIG